MPPKASTLMALARSAAPKANPAAPPNGLEAIALHPPVERRAGEAERGGGVADVALVDRKRPLDRVALQVVEVQGGARGAAGGGERGGGGLQHVGVVVDQEEGAAHPLNLRPRSAWGKARRVKGLGRRGRTLGPRAVRFRTVDGGRRVAKGSKRLNPRRFTEPRGWA